MDEQAAYLSDSAFSEPHRGEILVDEHDQPHGRDPSPDQIAAMRLAIRRAVPRDPVGVGAARFTVPVVAEDTFHVRSTDVFW